jgi:hypothetical protein
LRINNLCPGKIYLGGEAWKSFESVMERALEDSGEFKK